MQNGSKETWPEGDLFTWHGAQLILIPTVIVTGVLGNTLVLYVYTFRLRTSTVTLIKRMLAGLDLTSLLLAQPLMLYNILLPDSESFHHACATAAFLAFSTAMSSNCVLVMIAVDRFMRLCLLSARGIGTKNATRVLVCSIIFAALVNIPSAWLTGREAYYYSLYNIRVTHCSFKQGVKRTILFRVYCTSNILFLFLSLMALLFLYTKIITALRLHDRVRKQLSASTVGGTVLSQGISSTKMGSEVMQASINVFIAITVLYFLTYLFYLVIFFIYLLNENISDYITPYIEAAIQIATFSPMITSAVDPFIYSFTSMPFRQEVCRMLTRKREPKTVSKPAAVCSINEPFFYSDTSSAFRQEVRWMLLLKSHPQKESTPVILYSVKEMATSSGTPL
ncbi:hypothetical protein BsWGS_22271 [Bradybaena similaris]